MSILPEVSIVVPIYNKKNDLEDCLKSIERLNFTNFEVILVDDGSTDGSTEIAKEFAKHDERFVYHYQDNQGLSSARNTGIDLARSEWVTFHDADDYLTEDGLGGVLAAAKLEKADVAAGVFQRQNGDNIRVDKAFQIHALIQSFKTDETLAKKFATHFSCCNKIFKKSILQNHKFIPGLFMQDMDFWLRLMFTDLRFLQTEHVFATYVARENSESRQRTPKRFQSLFDLYDGLDEHYKANDLQAYNHIWQFALLQGAIAFFAKWKLEESATSDLDKIRSLLLKIPEGIFEAFFNEKNMGNIVPILISIRRGHYALAAKANQLGPQHFRTVLNRPATLNEIYAAISPDAPPYQAGLVQKLKSKFFNSSN